MMANPRFASAPVRLVLVGMLAALAASCAAPPAPPQPPVPAPRPTYVPPPPPLPRPALNWRDTPIMPGTWRWSMDGGVSSAKFAEGPGGAQLELRCDRAGGTVLLIRAGAASGPVAMTVNTTSVSRPLTAQPLAGATAVVVRIPARDPLLDAMNFSRGRFAIETQGLPPLYAPSWPEVGRVIEDCR